MGLTLYEQVYGPYVPSESSAQSLARVGTSDITHPPVDDIDDERQAKVKKW